MTDDEDTDGDAFNDQLGNALSGRVGKRPEEASESTDDESTGDAGDSDHTSSPSDTDSTDDAHNSGDTGSTGSSDSASSADTTSETSSPGPDPDPTSTRNTRTKYPIYLTEEFQEELNQRYKRMNAQRIMDDEPEIEKHKHFLEAVLQAGLERGDLDDYVEDMVEQY